MAPASEISLVSGGCTVAGRSGGHAQGSLHRGARAGHARTIQQLVTVRGPREEERGAGLARAARGGGMQRGTLRQDLHASPHPKRYNTRIIPSRHFITLSLFSSAYPGVSVSGGCAKDTLTLVPCSCERRAGGAGEAGAAGAVPSQAQSSAAVRAGGRPSLAPRLIRQEPRKPNKRVLFAWKQDKPVQARGLRREAERPHAAPRCAARPPGP